MMILTHGRTMAGDSSYGISSLYVGELDGPSGILSGARLILTMEQ